MFDYLNIKTLTRADTGVCPYFPAYPLPHYQNGQTLLTFLASLPT